MLRHRNARITAHNMTDKQTIALAFNSRNVLGLHGCSLAYVCEILAHAMPDSFTIDYSSRDDNMPQDITLQDLITLDYERVLRNPRHALQGIEISASDRANYPHLFNIEGELKSAYEIAQNRLIEIHTQAFRQSA